VADHRLKALRLAMLAAVVALAAGCGADGSRQRDPPRAVVSVDVARPGRLVPRSFLGISIEWDSLAAYAGAPGHRHAALRPLLAPLVRETGGLALRVGGDTADQAWWNPRGAPRPPTVLQDVTPGTLDTVSWLARTLGGPVTLGLNLALDDPANARALATAARAQLPRGVLDTLEIGNEPDLYTRGHVFTVPGHVHRRVRKRAVYTPAIYRRDATAYLDALSAHPAQAPRLAVAGFAGPGWWTSRPGLIGSTGGRVGALSAHLYALPRCGGRPPPLSWLLTRSASRGRAATLEPLVALGHRRGLPVRVTELNSAACGGRPGWSDTFTAALWLTDTLFALVHDGLDQADVHTWAHARYALFDVTANRVTPRPPLTGMLAFARAAPLGSRLVPARSSPGSALRAWATVDARGTVRVALIAADASRASVPDPGGGCADAWIATPVGRRVVHECPVGGRLSLALPARSLAVVAVPAAR
jgi:hypothetical protein